MKVLKDHKDLELFLKVLKKRASGINLRIEKKVRDILEDVRNNGDKALIKYTRRFDSLETKMLRLSNEEIDRYAERTEKDIVRALKFSAKRIKRFHNRQKNRSWSLSEDGIFLGQLVKPIERVGVYVPGGKASYPSSVLMNVIPAQLAGVKEIVLCVPTPKGEINPYVMAVIRFLGIKEVYRIGGAQAIGAMAFGTETIKKVDKIVGPGNIYVSTAKKMVFGEVDIDMIAGPSEILIIADGSANPLFIAADLLSQAEHDENASAILITNSNKLVVAVEKEINRQISKLNRKKIAKKSLDKYGALIITDTLRKAVDISNIIAPEHIEVMVEKPKSLLPLIKNAGAIFLGSFSPEALGDYIAGPNHILPTGGTARFSSPLGVYDFIKRSSILSFRKDGFLKLADTVKKIALAEGLEAHANSVAARENALDCIEQNKRN